MSAKRRRFSGTVYIDGKPVCVYSQGVMTERDVAAIRDFRQMLERLQGPVGECRSADYEQAEVIAPQGNRSESPPS